VADYLGCSLNAVQKRRGVPDASARMFPHLQVVIAYRPSFGAYSGIVPDGIDDLLVDDIDWLARDDPAVLHQTAHRWRVVESAPKRPSGSSNSGWPIRRCCGGHLDADTARCLWIGVERPGTAVIFSGAVHRNTIKAWVLQRRSTR